MRGLDWGIWELQADDRESYELHGMGEVLLSAFVGSEWRDNVAHG